ncbi:probable E3 ubiquitin-protein ligase makorin-1 isoform X1 [Asterias rubens]|uniref:probable E3 ubiquitin-protein ligase makorin-1 isoform X1 n=1 Tax=Asterias rubens TaxID=7604 RepID=UPI0014558ACF|nr:probable E3 ubiquitin-protein ligase makorin-1 isoform X1 [Asterias rubens]
MATAESPGPNTDWHKNITCRYYIHGVCRAGDNCRYAHDQSGKPSNICKFYLGGNCRFGTTCRFDHVKPKQKQSTQQNKTTSSKTKATPSLEPSVSSKMVTLKKGKVNGLTQRSSGSLSPPGKVRMEDVIGAAEFVPGQLYIGSVPPTYSAAATSGLEPTDVDDTCCTPCQNSPNSDESATPCNGGTKELLCPFALKGTCRFGENCKYMHGDVCDMCGSACLIMDDPVQNKHHREFCLAEHEKSMKEAFAFQNSKEVKCCICFELILEKMPAKDRKFGLLSNCNHAYCLSCIRKWRSAKQYEKKVVRACPTCRVPSPFVTPSDFWVDEPEEKKKVLERYKHALSKKECKYFRQGSGSCPFGAECFYLHAYPDGSKEDRSKARHYGNGDGKIKAYRALSLWDFFEERENRFMDWDSDDDDDWFLYYDWSEDFDFSDIEDHGLWSDYFEFFGSSESSDYSDEEDVVVGESGRTAPPPSISRATGVTQGATAAVRSTASTDTEEDDNESDHARLLNPGGAHGRPSKDCVYL